jgi:membrane dipeptidase
MNALEWNRDLSRPLEEIRLRERGATDKPGRGAGVVSLPEMRRGNVGICVATQIARYVKSDNPLPGWFSPEQAWAHTQGQLAWYRAMEGAGEMTQIRSREELRRHADLWNSNESKEKCPVGYVLSLEGADSLVSLAYLEKAYASGLRAIGPAHYGPGVYAQGTDATGGLGARGRELLAEMDRLGMILDVTHLCDDSFWEALDLYRGPIWASHSNCRAIVPHHRQFSDEQIKILIQRGAVIGAAFDAWMMIPNWVRGKTTPASSGVKIEHIIPHIEHICQLAGNSRHVGIGSDLDGGFGGEQTAGDLGSIADLQRIAELLKARGFKQEDIDAVMHGNFLRFLEQSLPN